MSPPKQQHKVNNDASYIALFQYTMAPKGMRPEYQGYEKEEFKR